MSDKIDEAIANLERAYLEYSAALAAVLNLGGSAVPSLIAALSHKRANPIVEALGYLLLTEPSAEAAILPLARNLGCNPLHADCTQALVRAGARILPTIIEEIEMWQQEDNDEGVRNMLDVATRLPERFHGQLMPTVLGLLSHRNSDIRDAATAACWSIGLPAAQCAVSQLQELASSDENEDVRQSAKKALSRLGG